MPATCIMSTTGCDGVVIGRGCLGRPWLFAELSAVSPAAHPTSTLGEVADIIRRHGTLLAAHFGEDKGMRDIRKHTARHPYGFPGGPASAGVSNGQDVRRARLPAGPVGRHGTVPDLRLALPPPGWPFPTAG